MSMSRSMSAMCMAISMAFAGNACAQAAASVPAEKQALVNRVLAKMALDSVGLQMLQAPVAEMVRQSRVVVTSRVPAEKQDAVMKDVNAEANAFLEKERRHCAPAPRRWCSPAWRRCWRRSSAPKN